MVDLVVDRRKMRETIVRMLDFMMNKAAQVHA
jgi:acetyl-CoA carboxylase beta subunit